MAKDFNDKFYEDLQGRVIVNEEDGVGVDAMDYEQKIKILSQLPIQEIRQAIANMPLEEQKKILAGCIALVDANVIKDPRSLENLKKELANVDKKIKKQKAEKAVETGNIVVEEEDEQKEERNEEGLDEESKSHAPKTEEEIEEEANKKANEEKLKQAYYDAMMALHEKRIKTINKQKRQEPVALFSSDEDYAQELKLEAKLYDARDAYMSLGLQDPYTELRTELIKKEKDAREPIEMQLRNMAKRYKEIEQKLKELDEEEQEIQRIRSTENVTETQIEISDKELEEIRVKREKLEVERAEIKTKLDKAITIRTKRLDERTMLERKLVATLSEEDMKNYRYQQSKVTTMNRNFDAATKQHYEGIKKRIEERQHKIYKITKQLHALEEDCSTDFERRLLLLNDLERETHMLEADKEAKVDLERGHIISEQEMSEQAREKSENEEYRQKQFDKSTQGVREAISVQKEQIGENVVANPERTNEEERDRDTTYKAAVAAAVYDNPEPGKDTLAQDAGQFAVAKCVIQGLEDQVRDPNNPEDAIAMVEQDEQLSKANEELNRVQEDIENNLST